MDPTRNPWKADEEKESVVFFSFFRPGGAEEICWADETPANAPHPRRPGSTSGMCSIDPPRDAEDSAAPLGRMMSKHERSTGCATPKAASLHPWLQSTRPVGAKTAV